MKPNKNKLTPFQKKQYQRLLDLRDELVDATQGLTRDTLKAGSDGSDMSGSGMHTADAGSDAYDKDLALKLLSQETNALTEVEEALRRMESNTYGICEESGKPIPEARLEALPFARLTVECQAEKESQNKNVGSQDNVVGFSY